MHSGYETRSSVLHVSMDWARIWMDRGSPKRFEGPVRTACHEQVLWHVEHAGMQSSVLKQTWNGADAHPRLKKTVSITFCGVLRAYVTSRVDLLEKISIVISCVDPGVQLVALFSTSCFTFLLEMYLRGDRRSVYGRHPNTLHASCTVIFICLTRPS